MILREKTGLFELLFATQGSVLPHILPRIIGVSLLAVLIVWVDSNLVSLPHTNVAPFAVFGIALSLFLGFRNNAAYDRWWEGRRLWGQLVADMRSLGRECVMFLPEDAARNEVLRLALSFLHLHRGNLRKISDSSAAKDWSGVDFSDAPHPPCAALSALNARAANAAPDGFARKALSERLSSIALAQAGCERIAATPLPYVYSLLVFRTTYLYCLLIPFALLDDAGWMTPLFVAIVAYVFFGLAEVTEELAHPFGETVNGLPLDAMCRTVEISMAPHLGVDAPKPLAPKGYYQS
ncbi:bestrophin family protein [Pseudophaeobacter sp.]|uniref:bestrophin family protein n=1 Tax=Pseudophaeobacter sp. TaxID=1971739 RepID=UPI003296E2A2